MATSFASPADYLAHVQQCYAKAYVTKFTEDDFSRMTRSQLGQLNVSMDGLGEHGGLEWMVNDLRDTLLKAVDEETRKRIDAHMAIGLLINGQANAFVIRSSDGKLAVVIQTGLMMLLHKYLKLVRAFVTPADVVYCNRKSASDLTKADIEYFLDDLIAIYKDQKAPYGPMIKLTDEANASHSVQLELCEAFILCHELGHYLNGDLDDASAFSALSYGADGQKYEENRNQEIEYNADSTGFGLYLLFAKARGHDTASLELLKPILAMFNLVFALSGGASSSHPHPYDRVKRIVEYQYGPELGARMAEALAKPDLLPEVWKQGKP